MMKIAIVSATFATLMATILASPAAAATSPSAANALKLVPVQKGVDYDRPTAKEIPKCKIAAKKLSGNVGWIVENPQGTILRRFMDTNGDNVVDQWSYYKNGLEVYRDIDANFNNKADQYRWFHTAGTRWGLDKNEDGEIDAWKVISAEEVTAEIIAALARRDARRFNRVVLLPGEVKSLGLGKQKSSTIGKRVARLPADFASLAKKQTALAADTKWRQFNGSKPGIVPAGTDGSIKDLVVYENVMAIIESGGKHGQVQIGTLVKLGDTWRAIDLPQSANAQASLASAGSFFQASVVNPVTSGQSGSSSKVQELLSQLENLDKAAVKAGSPTAKAKFNAQRANLLEQIADASGSAADRAMWMRQLADMVSAAVQSGAYPEGAQRLGTLAAKLQKNKADESLAAYVKFRQMTAAYGLSLQAPKADFNKIQKKWLADLKKYITDYPKGTDTPEAMLQLAIAEEFGGEEADAKKWYTQLAAQFPNTTAAKKAAGAATRLNSVGKSIAIRGAGLHGKPVDLADYRGRVVLVQYWATWCQPCKNDFPMIKELKAKYGKSLGVIGINLDNNPKDLKAYLTENRLPWQQIYEPGGLDSRPANQMGILTLPTMILVDRQGKVVNRNVQAAELSQEIKKLIR